MSSIWVLLLVAAGLILLGQFLRRPHVDRYRPHGNAGRTSRSGDAHAADGATGGPTHDEHAGRHRHSGC